MARFDPLAYRDPVPSPLLIRALSPVVRHVVLPLLKIRRVDLPDDDLARLRAGVGEGKAVFFGPNHPEFMTDWIIDKEVSTRVAPLMAHWASYEIVNMDPLSQALWLRNNLVANAPGGGGRAYSVRWALAGHGVLLHPEGTPSWQGDLVGPLVPGIVEMALEASRSAQAFIAPLVWKLRFTRDVGRELHGEMRRIERGLGLASGEGVAVAERFVRLQRAILARSLERYPSGVPAGGDFFTVQETHAAALLARLEAAYGATAGPWNRRLHGLRRAILAARAAGDRRATEDRRTLLEIERLARFMRALYGGPTLTQEQVAESLKRIRLAFLTKGWRDALHGVMPVAIADRVAHVRAPEPIAVSPGDDPAALLAALHARLQGALDALNAELAPQIDRYRMNNGLEADEPALARS
jgi:hypothetical protein